MERKSTEAEDCTELLISIHPIQICCAKFGYRSNFPGNETALSQLHLVP
jgi:hypothetical protein